MAEVLDWTGHIAGLCIVDELGEVLPGSVVGISQGAKQIPFNENATEDHESENNHGRGMKASPMHFLWLDVKSRTK